MRFFPSAAFHPWRDVRDKKCWLFFYLDMWSACSKVKTHCARISALRKKIIQISGFIATVECHGINRHLRMRWTQWYSPKHLLTMWSILRDSGNDDDADDIMIKISRQCTATSWAFELYHLRLYSMKYTVNISYWLNGFPANEEYWNISLKADVSLSLIGWKKSRW